MKYRSRKKNSFHANEMKGEKSRVCVCGGEGGKKKRAEMELQSELLSICTFHEHYDNGGDQLATFLVFNFFSFRTLLSLHYKPAKTYKTIRK